jgi:hypothetical protein
MALEGSLEVFNLPEILQMVAMQKKTGILTVQGEADIVAVSFLNGQVVAADALNQTVEEGLGLVLSKMQLVKPEDFAAVAAEHQAGGGRMVDLLQERGYVERPQLLRALRSQTYNLLVLLLDWKRGDFKFYGGDEVSYEEGFEPITVEEVLARDAPSAEVSKAAAAKPAADEPQSPDVFARVSPPPQRVRVLDEVGDGGPRDGSGIWVSRDEKAVLDRLDGRRTLEEIARDSKLGSQRASRALERLLEMGLAQAPGAQAPRRTVPPPVLLPALEKTPAPAPKRASAAPQAAAAKPAPKLAAARPPEALRFESFPSEPTAAEPRDASVAKPRVAARRKEISAPAWPGLALATGLLILILVVSAARPGLLLLPYPWQETARTGLERAQRSSLYFKIDRACRTFFLLEGRYPDDLGQLVDLRLLGKQDLQDPRGRPLAYSSEELSYAIHPVEGGEPLADLGRREAVTGDFLLDAEFTKLPTKSEVQALVLLN